MQCGMVDSYAIMEIIIITKSAQQLKTKMSREEYLILEDWKKDKSMKLNMKLNMKLIMKLEIKKTFVLAILLLEMERVGHARCSGILGLLGGGNDCCINCKM